MDRSTDSPNVLNSPSKLDWERSLSCGTIVFFHLAVHLKNMLCINVNLYGTKPLHALKGD